MHRQYPHLVPDIDLFHYANYMFKVVHNTKGHTPHMLLNDNETDEGLLCILNAHDALQDWHRSNIFQGGISIDTMLLEKHLNSFSTTFIDWSSCHNFTRNNGLNLYFRDFQKLYYPEM